MGERMSSGVSTEGQGPSNQRPVTQVRLSGTARFRRVTVLVLVCMVALSYSALATDGTGSGSGLSAVTGSLSTVTTIVSAVFELILGNPLLALYVAIGLVGAGIAVFRKLRKASH